MSNHLDILVLIWVFIVTVAWVAIRKYKPEWLGLGHNPNNQKIDGVRYNHCPQCKDGVLTPQFKWWQYCIGVTLPPGIIFIAGNPAQLLCTKCNFHTKNIGKKRLFSRISLSHKLSKEFFISLLVNLFVITIGFTIWFSI